MMKTAAPSSECAFPFSHIKYVDCSVSELHRNLICISSGDEDTNWFSQPFAVVDPSIRPSSTIEVSDGAITLLFP